jgi:hypothetical protein
MFRTTAICGWNSSTVSNWKLDTSSTLHIVIRARTLYRIVILSGANGVPGQLAGWGRKNPRILPLLLPVLLFVIPQRSGGICFSLTQPDALIDQLNHRRANVSAHQRRPPRIGKDLAQQRSRGGLAIGAGDRHHLPLKKPAGQLQFANNRRPQRPIRPHLLQLRRIERHARRHHDQVLPAEGQQPVSARLDHDAGIEQRGNLSLQRHRAARIGNSYTRSLVAQKQRRRHPTLPQPHHQHALILQFHLIFLAKTC